MLKKDKSEKSLKKVNSLIKHWLLSYSNYLSSVAQQGSEVLGLNI